MSGLLLVVGKLRQLHKNIGCGVVSWAFDLQVLRRSMHPVLFPFSQPKSSHQSSKLHPDPDCAVLCRCPMWRPFPSLFRNNWSCHRWPFGCRSTLPHPRQHLPFRNSDTATTSTLLQSLLDLLHRTSATLPTSNSLPKLYGRNPDSPNKTTVCRSLMLVVIPGDVGLVECHKQAMMKTMKTMKIHQSMLLWKHVHWACSAVLLVLTV